MTSASCVAALLDLACESGTAKTEATQTLASGYLYKKYFNSIAGLKEKLLSRMFVQRIPGLQSSSAEATHHIKHQYSKQMALKSEVVCSYLLLLHIPNLLLLMHSAIGCDAKKRECSRRYDILDGLHRYIPTTTTSQTLDVCTEGGRTRAVEVKLHNFSFIPLGGDQLTIARIRGSQSILSNSDNGEERLEGFVPVIEDWIKDWHTKMHVLYGGNLVSLLY